MDPPGHRHDGGDIIAVAVVVPAGYRAGVDDRLGVADVEQDSLIAALDPARIDDRTVSDAVVDDAGLAAVDEPAIVDEIEGAVLEKGHRFGYAGDRSEIEDVKGPLRVHADALVAAGDRAAGLIDDLAEARRF